MGRRFWRRWSGLGMGRGRTGKARSCARRLAQKARKRKGDGRRFFGGAEAPPLLLHFAWRMRFARLGRFLQRLKPLLVAWHSARLKPCPDERQRRRLW